MGRAFTDEERGAVQEKLRRTGLALFAEKGIRGVSIRDLTSAAGIAQGGFYTFYADKEEFLADLIEFRVREKLDILRKRMADSLGDPAGYLADLMYSEGMHLRENRAFDNRISGSLAFFEEDRGGIRVRLKELYRTYLEELAACWQENGYAVEMDIDGLLNMAMASGILFSSADLLEEGYFVRIFRNFCDAGTAQFVRAVKKTGEKGGKA